MGASFRNKGEIIELAGCDLLTISPGLLGELQACDRRRSNPASPRRKPPRADHREGLPRREGLPLLLNEDAMATEKTAQGIRAFSADIVKLEKLIEGMI